jgi:hypothetical protein
MSSADNPVEPENLIAAALDAAEDIRDPLDGLVEKTATDPGAPFAPDALARLAALKQDDRAAFEGAAGTTQESRLPGDGARRVHRRGKWRHGRARSDAGQHPDGVGASGRAIPHPGRNRLRRPRHRRPSRNLAGTEQGLPALVGAPLLRGDARRAEFGSAAIRAECD